MTDDPLSRAPRAALDTLTEAGASMRRRSVLSAGLGLAAAFALRPARASATVRIGYQKYGSLVLLKGRGSLAKALAPLGYEVAWSEFPSGSPLLEALNAGAIDLGSAGEAPPIFAQAASADLRYVGTEPPAPRGEAILVPKDSPVRSVAELRGKTIALNKGSNVHFLVVRALEKAGLPYDAVKLVFLSPADANAAFVRGAVDAWAIWDPYLAAAERSTGARVLADGSGIAPNRQFYLSRRGFTEASPEVVVAILRAVAEVDTWAAGNGAAVAAELAPSVGILAPVLAVALDRLSYGVAPPRRAGDRRPAGRGRRLPRPRPPAQSQPGRRRGLDPSGTQGGDPMSATPSRIRDAALPWLLPVAIVLGWQAAVSAGLVSNRFMPAPLDVVRAGIEAGRTGELWTNLGVSTLRALAGFVVGGGIGFGLGLANGLSRLSERLTDTSVQMVRNVPHLSLIPLVILWFGIGEEAKLFLVALGVFFPIYANTLHGIRSVDPALVEMGRVYGMSNAELFRRVVLPGALPSIFVGLRYALGIMWLTLIVAETISASSGLGYMAMQAREFMLVDVVVLAILIYAALGKLADALTRQLERSCLAWNPAYRSA